MELNVELAADPTSVAIARHELRARLHGVVGDDVIHDLELIVSELVTNSVRHGPGKPIVLRVDSNGGHHITGEIVDHGDGTVAMRRAGDNGDGREGGLGLHIVDALASEWGVHAGTTDVWFVLER